MVDQTRFESCAMGRGRRACTEVPDLRPRAESRGCSRPVGGTCSTKTDILSIFISSISTFYLAKHIFRGSFPVHCLLCRLMKQTKLDGFLRDTSLPASLQDARASWGVTAVTFSLYEVKISSNWIVRREAKGLPVLLIL